MLKDFFKKHGWRYVPGVLLLILCVRSTLTLLANTNGITGGIFLPLLSLGAVLASALGQGLVSAFGLSESY